MRYRLLEALRSSLYGDGDGFLEKNEFLLPESGDPGLFHINIIYILFVIYYYYINMQKKSILGFLKNGSDYFPFGDQNKLPENSISSQGSFVPF